MLISWHRFRRGLDPNTHMFKAWDETHDIPPLIPKTNTTPTKNKTAWHSGVESLTVLTFSTGSHSWKTLRKNRFSFHLTRQKLSPSSLGPDPLTEQLLGSNVVPRLGLAMASWPKRHTVTSWFQWACFSVEHPMQGIFCSYESLKIEKWWSFTK